MKWIVRFFTGLICGLLALGIASCDSDSPDIKKKKASRTVLVYMVATNNLGADGADSDDLDEMIAAAMAGAIGDGRWLVYHAPANASAPGLIEITADGKTELKSYEPGMSVTTARMSEVLDDMTEMAPAASYGLVLWSHATGWLQDGIEENTTEPLSFGSDLGEKMNITSLRSVLEGRNIDYLYVDACFMASVEVAYELRHAVKHIVASASELPRDGMPYDLNVAPLISGTRDNLIKAATNTFNLYNSKPDAELRTCTMSVISTDALDDLAAATAEIYKLTPLPHPGRDVTNYRGTARQGYSIDFGEYVNALADESDIDSSLTDNFNAALHRVIVYEAATAKLWDIWPIYNHSGLSTFVFNSNDNYNIKGYDTLEWFSTVAQHHIHPDSEQCD